MSEKRFEATLGGVEIGTLADEIVLFDIVEKPAEMDTQTVPLTWGEGSRRIRNTRKSLSVELHFAIRTQDVVRRAEVRDLLADWAANGGALKVNYRPDRVLYVKDDTPPALGSSLNWTDEIVLTLTAYAVPYWQSAKATGHAFETKLLDSGENWYANLINPDGNAGMAKVDAIIYHVGEENLTHLYIKCGKTFFEFSGMNLEPGAIIMISYDDGILSVVDFSNVESDNSLLKYRTAESSDDLLAVPNQENALQISADQPLEGRFTARGIWR
jgi:hypothetical protein